MNRFSDLDQDVTDNRFAALDAEANAPVSDSWDYVVGNGGSLRNVVPMMFQPAYDDLLSKVEDPAEFESEMAASMFLGSVLGVDEGYAFDMKKELGRHLFKKEMTPSQMVMQAMKNEGMIDRFIQNWERAKYWERIDEGSPGWWKQRVNAAAIGTANVGSGLAGRFDVTRNWTTDPVVARLQQQGQMQDGTTAWYDDPDLLWRIANDPELASRDAGVMTKLLDMGLQTLPYITATTASSLAFGPLGGFSVGWMVEGNSAYRTALDRGVPDDKARRIGMAVGIVSGAVESFGFAWTDEMMKSVTARIESRVLAGALNFGVGTGTEAAEETLQELSAIAGELTYRTDLNWREGFGRTLTAAAGGAVLGGTMKLGSAAMRGVTDTATTRKQRQQLRFMAAQGELSEELVKQVEQDAQEVADAEKSAAQAEGTPAPGEGTGASAVAADVQAPAPAAETVAAGAEEAVTDNWAEMGVTKSGKAPWQMSFEEWQSDRMGQTTGTMKARDARNAVIEARMNALILANPKNPGPEWQALNAERYALDKELDMNVMGGDKKAMQSAYNAWKRVGEARIKAAPAAGAEEEAVTPTVAESATVQKMPWEMTKEEWGRDKTVLYRGAKTKEGLRGQWWTPSKKYAQHYSHGGGMVAEGRIASLRLLNRDLKRDDAEWKRITMGATTPQEQQERIVAAGYDGVSYFKGKEVHIYNPAKLPRSHVDIVQQAVSEGKPVPRAVLEEYASEPWAQEALTKLGPQGQVTAQGEAAATPPAAPALPEAPFPNAKDWQQKNVNSLFEQGPSTLYKDKKGNFLVATETERGTERSIVAPNGDIDVIGSGPVDAKRWERMEAPQQPPGAKEGVQPPAQGEIGQPARADATGEGDSGSAELPPGIAEQATGDPLPQIGVKNADTRSLRNWMGLDGIPSPEKQTRAQWLQEAKEQKIPENATTIALDALAKKRAMTPQEHEGLMFRLWELTRRGDELASQGRKAGTDAEKQSIDRDRKEVESQVELITRALIESGTPEARAMVSRQAMLDDTGNLTNNLARAKINKGKDLTAKERAKVEELTAQIVALQTENARLTAEQAKSEAEGVRKHSRSRSRWSKMDPAKKDAELTRTKEKLRKLLEAGC